MISNNQILNMKLSRWGAYFNFLILFLSSTCFSQEKENLVESIFYAPAIDSVYTIQTIQSIHFSKLKSPKIGYKNGTYWFKVFINQNKRKEKMLVFDFQEPSIEAISIYNNKQEIGFNQRELGASTPVIEITNDKSLVYYIKATFKRQVNFPLLVTNSKTYYKNTNFKYLFSGLYYGLVLMVFLINLSFYISLKDKVFIYYCYFLASINFAFTSFDGILYLVFPPNSIDPILICFHFLVAVCGVLFAGDFLNLDTHLKKAHTIGKYLLIVPLLCYGFFFILDEFIFCALGDLFGILILAYYWALGVFTLKKEAFALFFVLGYSMVLVAAIFFLTPLNFGVPIASVSFNQLKLGALFEMMVLTYAITYRAKKTQEENINIQSELKNHIIQVTDLEEKIKATKHNNNIITTEERILQLATEHNLTERETDVLLQISLGLNNQQIADKLFISINTIKYHTRNLYEKLNVKKRTEITSKLLFDR